MTLRVMLIDDHPVVRAGLRAVLNSFGDMEVVAEAADGDVEVPEGVDVVAAVEAGAMGYLLKDAPEDELYDAVVRASQRTRVLSPQVANVLADRLVNPVEALSAREIELLRALQTGASNREIAEQLFISQATVKTHLIHIYAKLGVDNRTAAVEKARQRRII